MDEKIILKSKNKLIIIGLLIILLNPIFAGLIFSLFMRSEPQLKKESNWFFLLSFVWGGILFALSNKISQIIGF